MSHYPFVLQAQLGIPPKPQQPRTDHLADDVPVVFGDLNWNHCENGTAHPIAEDDGAITLMGPGTTPQAGHGSKWPDAAHLPILGAAEILREAGYVIPIVPDDYEPPKEDDNSGGGARKEDRERPPNKRQKKEGEERKIELEYLKSEYYNYEPIAIRRKPLLEGKSTQCSTSSSTASSKKDKGESDVVATMFTMSLDDPWLVVECTTPDVASSIQELLADDFALMEVRHETKTLPRDMCDFEEISEGDKDYSVVVTSGKGSGDETHSSVSTIFELRRKGKVVAKALCTYQNSEMNSVGPTVELLEVAQQWRRHGLGLALMRTVESFYVHLCDPILLETGRFLFSVCYVTNAYASTWFLENCDFQDLDGMGEELGKYLYL